MSESSGIFTFPSTGLYLVRYNILGEAIANDNILGSIKTTTNNTSRTYLCSSCQFIEFLHMNPYKKHQIN